MSSPSAHPARAPQRASAATPSPSPAALVGGLGACLALVALAAPSAAQETPAGEAGSSSAERFTEACRDVEQRRFDFWVGDWIVRNPEGERVGTNRIRPVAGGCGIEESWQGEGGAPGASLNFYDPEKERWVQHWVSGRGYVLHLTGGWRDGAMVLSGRRATEDGRLDDRITWTPLEDGRVRQLWEVSKDGGETWEALFEGYYERR